MRFLDRDHPYEERRRQQEQFVAVANAMATNLNTAIDDGFTGQEP